MAEFDDFDADKITVQPRRSGKVINRVIAGSMFDPQTREYRLADGTSITEEELTRLSPATLNGLANRVQAVLQQTQQPAFNQPVLTTNTGQLKHHTAIRWVESGRFTYMALWVQPTLRWYITGSGAHYGGNELTHGELLLILKRPSVTNRLVAGDWQPLG